MIAAVEVGAAKGQHPFRHVHLRHDELLCVLDGGFTVVSCRRAVPTRTPICAPRSSEHRCDVGASGRRLGAG